MLTAVFVGPLVVEELKRIVRDSEITKWAAEIPSNPQRGRHAVAKEECRGAPGARGPDRQGSHLVRGGWMAQNDGTRR